jgi:hypothetical protein
MSVRSDPAVVRGVEPTPTLDAVCARVLAVLTWPMPERTERRQWRAVRARLRASVAAYGRLLRVTGIRRQQLLGGITALVRRASTRLPHAVGAAYAPGDIAAWALAAYDAAGTRSALVRRRRSDAS